ncbi:AAA family ATPase [Caballeronia sp. LZ019]|uniref:AAA family ATPase n=1 Tax=Caballeronia sp. LZ019 TaxID=3038555 RepID=UPI0028642ED1|nr:AAA family ATPase [Caballeronia sp. LZ019]MDR5811356.1 AAA family ATPase [Caballeronia sp. LZ019]
MSTVETMNGAPSAASAFADESAALAEGFARRIGELSRWSGADARAVAWAERAALAISRATALGHVCMPLAALARRHGESVREARDALLASGVATLARTQARIDAAALRPLVIDEDGRLYLARYFDYERRLAVALVERARGARIDVSQRELAQQAGRIARYFGQAPADDDDIDWQRVAALVALAGRLTIVSGGPGTGKTTTVVGVLACLLDADPTLRIALAAPTGKAAQRMQEALIERADKLPPELAARLPRTSFTLQRLLGVLPDGGFRHHRDNPLPYDVIVVDEASMIDVALAAHLLEAVAPSSRLVMLGDKDQLSAVEAGAVFAELSAQPTFSEAGARRIAGALGVALARLRAALPASGAEGRRNAAALERPGARIETRDDDYGDFFPGDDDGEREPFIDAPVESGAEQGDLFSNAAAREREPAGAPSLDASRPRHEGADAPANASTPARLANAPHADDEGYADLFATLETGASEANETPADAPLTDSVVWLARNYRFGLDSAIGRLSIAIRDGDAQAALDALDATQPAAPEASAAVLLDDGHATLSDRTLAHLAKGFAPYAAALSSMLQGEHPPSDEAGLFDALNRFRVLCATRKGPRGVDEVNARIASKVREQAGIALAIRAQWFAGRPVIVTRNDYALGLFNGDIGIALPGPNGALRVAFRMADGSLRHVSPAALPPHDTAFALTVHKSQGSEFEHAALVLPGSFVRVLSRELVYTAITRAKRRIEVIGSAAIFAQAVDAPTRRDSGLAARMMRLMHMHHRS